MTTRTLAVDRLPILSANQDCSIPLVSEQLSAASLAKDPTFFDSRGPPLGFGSCHFVLTNGTGGNTVDRLRNCHESGVDSEIAG